MAAESTNQQIRDDLVSQDLDDRRVIVSVENDVEQRLDQLERDLAAAVVRVDPGGAQQLRSKKRRISELNKISRDLIRTAYSEINALTRTNYRRLARTESRATVLTIEKNLAG